MKEEDFQTGRYDKEINASYRWDSAWQMWTLFPIVLIAVVSFFVSDDATWFEWIEAIVGGVVAAGLIYYFVKVRTNKSDRDEAK